MGALVKIICLLPLLFVPGYGTFLPFFDPFGLFRRWGNYNGDDGDNNNKNNNNNNNNNPPPDIKPPLTPGNARNFDMERYKGSWELHTQNAGLSAMHLVLLPTTSKAVMFDAAVLGPSQVPQPQGHCRFEERSQKWDCWAHGVVYNTDNAEVRPLTVHTDTWCSSGGLMVDGTLLQTGGFEEGGRAMRFLATCRTCDWREYKVALSGQRWYGTQQTLADGSFVIVGGRRMYNYEFLPREGQVNDKNIPLPFLHETSDIAENNLYPFVLLAPDGNLFIFANNRSIILNPHNAAIVREFPVLPDGARNYPASGMAAFLPIQLQPGQKDTDARVEILICGGAKNYANEMAEAKNLLPALQSCGRMEITAPNAHWEMEDMPTRRVMGDMLTLPNGEMLLINGAQTGVAGWRLAEDPNFKPVLYRPSAAPGDRFRELNPSNIPRMYHSSSAVLPDGRILVAGSNTNDKYALEGVKYPTELRVEKFSPPYLDPELHIHRPQILQAAMRITYKQRFVVRFRQGTATDIQNEDVKVTFYSPPFTTHGFSQNQRMLVLAITRLAGRGGSYSVEVEAPPSGAIAPQGYYILFVVYRGAPSPGIWVQIK